MKENQDIDFQSFTYTIAAGDKQRIVSPYNYFRIMSLSGADEIHVRFQDGSKTPMPLSVGLHFDTEQNKLEIYNENVAPVVIEVSLAAGGRIDDSRVTIGGTLQTKETTNTLLYTAKSTGAWTHTPNAAVKNINIQATETGVFIGHELATKIYPIADGAAKDLKTTAIIYGTNACVIEEQYEV